MRKAYEEIFKEVKKRIEQDKEIVEIGKISEIREGMSADARNVYLKLQEEFSPSLTGLRRISEFGGYDFIIDSQGGDIIITPKRRDNGTTN